MHHNHAQKGFRCIAKHSRHADLRFSLQLTALHAGHGGMQTQGVFQHVDLVVIHHFIDWWGVAQKLTFQILRILPERFIGREAVGSWILFFKNTAQPLLGN
ncbi:hypothetical protein D3C86_1996740 [compost metagenome]